MENSKGFPTSHYIHDLDLYCRSYGEQRNSFHLRAGRATQKTSSNIFGGWKIQRAFQQAINTQDSDSFCKSYDDFFFSF
jgi:hypothetical protein